MFPVNLDELTPEHIQGLFDSEVTEGLRIEYKEQLPTDQSDDKRKFLYRVAGMANAIGGDLDLPRFSQPFIAGVSRFRFVGEYISPPS